MSSYVYWDTQKEPDGQLIKNHSDNKIEIEFILQKKCRMIDQSFVLPPERIPAGSVEDPETPLHLWAASRVDEIIEESSSCLLSESDEFKVIEKKCFAYGVSPKSQPYDQWECLQKPYTEPGGSQVPVAGGLFIATVVGSPVCFVAGIKLGMFAAIAGGIMGYTTGKMFADHE